MKPRRLTLVTVVLALAGVGVAARAAQVMVLEHGRYERLAKRQQRRTITVPSLRGEIRTADGYLLATSASRVAVQVDTHALQYPQLFAGAAAPILDLPAAGIERRLETGPRALWLAQRVERKTGEALRQLAPGAVILVPDSERLYPLHRLAAAVVGFTGREELRTVGRFGIEQSYETLLAGEPGRYLAVRDAEQRQVRLRRLQRGRPGFDLELTLNARLQAACEAVLRSTVTSTAAKGAAAVVLDPATGDILALASVPSFDPQDPAGSPSRCWRLRPVQDAYEPGSTVKPLVAAAALAAGAVRRGERFDCTQRGISVAGHWIHDHADPGRYTLDEIITHSSNAGMVEVAQRLDPELLWRTFVAFGLGRAPRIGLAGEASGLLLPVSSWSRLSPAGVSLGQELTVSPLQMALAYAAIANGGWLPRPRLVQRATGGLDVTSGDPGWRARVLDDALAERLQHMLEQVVEQGTGTEAAVDGYRVAGKTGTAQRATNGQFDDKHHVAWFAGFLPLPRPRAVIVVAVDEPSRDYWASSVAAPCFRSIAEEVLRLLVIPPAGGRVQVARAGRARSEAVL